MMPKTEQLRTIRCFYCGSITLMIPHRFQLGQLCMDCEKRLEDRQREEDKRKECGIVVELCNEVLAWKNEAVKRGYKGAIRLVYEDSDGKGVDTRYLVDMWHRQKKEIAELKTRLEECRHDLLHGGDRGNEG